ncbi:MAG: hypothetical protein HYY84_18045 [Deltaproteobacteria bacterium]|nr:hypothetical protein [Deltaproteobacteria bacterium]
MDIGINLVYSYLQNVQGCQLISPKVFVNESFPPLDLVAVDKAGEKVFLADVVIEFGETLPRLYDDPDSALENKIRSAIKFAKETFPTMRIIYTLWSPKVRKPVVERLRGLRDKLTGEGLEFDPVVNEDFGECVRELLKSAFTDTGAPREPAYRLLQILEHGHVRVGSGAADGARPNRPDKPNRRGFPCQFTVLDWTPHLESYSPRARDLPACKLKIDTLKWERAKDFKEINCPFSQNQRECNLFQAKRN